MISQEEKPMTRINSSGATGPQQIPSQDSHTQRVGKSETQKTQQEPGAAEQQQGKQTAQGRKNEIDLQGNLKQSELAQFHGPGGTHRHQAAEKNNKHAEVKKSPDTTHQAPAGMLSEQQIMERQQNRLSELMKAYEDEKKHPGLYSGFDALERKDSRRRAEERAAKEILDTYLPNKESNSSKKAE
jgi:hypothetical protein